MGLLTISAKALTTLVAASRNSSKLAALACKLPLCLFISYNLTAGAGVRHTVSLDKHAVETNWIYL